MRRLRPALVVHADWSVSAARRVMVAARPEGEEGWVVTPPEPVGPLDDLPRRLLARGGGGPVLFGIDTPLGVPERWAARAGLSAFAALPRLIGTPPWQAFAAVAETLEEVNPHRPFFPRRPGGHRRAAFAERLGLGSFGALVRATEAACARPPGTLFWTLGANQTGRAALVLWTEVLARADLRLWPFDGPLDRLLDRPGLVLAECYPAELRRRFGIDPAVARARLSGFAPQSLTGDARDAWIGCLGMLCCLDRPALWAVPRLPALAVEGWMLGVPGPG